MIVGPRHIEVQILGDKFGNFVHLGERDCTIQRRRQKLIEEAPSPVLSDDLRKKIGEAAINVVKLANYHSAGTVEFLLDKDLNFYFMEVNTRIQVEHTITEELTGVDIVKKQIEIADNLPLNLRQEEIEFKGHVFEFRINAENPSRHFSPSPGRVEHYLPPGGPQVRIDSHLYSGYFNPPYYDSMVAKLIVHGKTRDEARAISERALREFHIIGIDSTIPFHLYMLKDKNFISSHVDITYIDRKIDEGCTFTLDDEASFEEL